MVLKTTVDSSEFIDLGHVRCSLGHFSTSILVYDMSITW